MRFRMVYDSCIIRKRIFREAETQPAHVFPTVASRIQQSS